MNREGPPPPLPIFHETSEGRSFETTEKNLMNNLAKYTAYEVLTRLRTKRFMRYLSRTMRNFAFQISRQMEVTKNVK